MEQLLQKHPDLRLIDKSTLDQLTTYRSLDRAGKIIEYWEKRDGHWVDVTEREKLKEQIVAEQEEIERLAKLEAKKMAKKENLDGTSTDE